MVVLVWITIAVLVVAFLVLVAFTVWASQQLSRQAAQAEAKATRRLHPEAGTQTPGSGAPQGEQQNGQSQPEHEVPAQLRKEIDHALHLAEIEHNARQFAIIWRSYRRLAAMFPDAMDDIVKDEIARAEERDRGTDET
ncbi:hypothetical protein [Actinomadura decatromicini]|uniref:Uncharacterized protein n=1 Tax=Actinomadura decatromicini TaxID=2604572 RepID=A0A5D3FB13_9ACTN|nr:hypothetical protein [Actinomadura decatromicini]TYK45128.1 hypothetical protein FXF68_31080 [Actinomadura decatromicini]